MTKRTVKWSELHYKKGNRDLGTLSLIECDFSYPQEMSVQSLAFKPLPIPLGAFTVFERIYKDTYLNVRIVKTFSFLS